MSGRNLIRLGVLACIWGASFLLIKLALGGLSPIQIVLGRLTAGAVVLLIVALSQRKTLPREPTFWLHLTVMALVANIIPFFLFGWGQLRISSSLAGVLNATTPLFTMILAGLFLPEERFSSARISGLLLGFVGVAVIINPWHSGQAMDSIAGQLACLGAAVCYGVSFVYARKFITGRRLAPVALSAGQISLAALLLWIAAPGIARGEMNLTPVVVGSVGILGAIGTGVAYLLVYRLVEETGATSASLVTYVIPIVAVTLGVLVLDEPLSWRLFAGAGLVITGVVLAEGRLKGFLSVASR
ncbi:DMT family transporter [Hyalangium rubrum]|uniref:DMT family transporter n=1 Tax=Hyalangium rubrum TaxID=3103134 RepID=A0ABU5H5D8_9BACT|nr:DMT family transporter [Hyalangium sp. s54d21]MDY7228337.1 DMT family transporter [Hyalangium sp. s54d21]